MSNQNFDTNDPFPSSSQPIPIAKQLEAQAYLSQMQNLRKGFDSEEEKSSPAQLSGRFTGPAAPAEEMPPASNKMDAFFQKAEEDERQRVLEAQNPAEQAPEQAMEESSFEPVADVQQSQPVQQYETPVFELPQVELPQVVDMTGETFATQPEMAAPTEEAQENQAESAEFSPAPQTSSPFSSGSFSTGSMGQNPISDSPSQFSTHQNEPIDPTSYIPPAVEDQLTSQHTPTSQPQIETFDSTENFEPAEATGDSEARRLTGAAGLSAGLALAGMGGFGALKTSALSPENEEPVESQPGNQPLATDNPIESLGQQFADDRGQEPSSADTTMPSVDEGKADAASETSDANQPNDTPFDPSPANVYGVDKAPPLTRQNVFAENVSSSPHEIPPAVTSGFSGGFNSFEQTRVASASENGEQDAIIDSAPPSNEQPSNEQPSNEQPSNEQPCNEQPSNEEQSNMPSAAPQVEAEQAQPPQSSAPIQDGGNEVVDMRLAAEQQAQRIKADRARAHVDGPEVAARPYGADRQRIADADHQNSVLENLSTPDADRAPVVNPQQQPPAQTAPVDSQPYQAASGKPLGEGGNEDGSRKPRSFPMELFNQKLLKNLRSGVVYVDHKRRVQLWSKGAETMTGIVSDAVIERPLYPQTYNLRFEDGSGVPMDQCPVVKCLETMETVTADYRTLNADNQEVKIEVAITPVVDEQRYVNGAIIIFNDHTAEIDLQRQLKDLYEFSVLDPLTQVANRAEFERVLEEYVRAFNQSESFNCSIIICDIDFFKSINDNFGHAVGDQALVAFSEMLKKYVRSQDLVARYGGEEFVILCADCDTDSALQRAEQIRMGLFKTQQKMLGGKSISASFGVSELRTGDTAMEFFVRADTALLKAKELGRNRVVIADQREAGRNVDTAEDGSLSGMQWRQQRREHTALICEEFKTSTPISVLVEKLRGFIVEKDAWLQRVDQEFLSMEVDFEAPDDYSRKGCFTMNIEFKEGDDNEGGRVNKNTFIRVTIFPGRKKKWFSTNHTDVAPYLLADLRSYLMINDEASHITIEMATEDVRAHL